MAVRSVRCAGSRTERKGPVVEGPSTRELVERRLAAMSAPRSLEEAHKDVIAAWRHLGETLQAYVEALERRS